MYLYHNKELNEYYKFGNMKALSDKTGISHDTLKSKFSRQKLDRWDDRNGKFSIIKFK